MVGFLEQLHKVYDLLKSEGRISYRAIKREFDIDDDVLEDIKTELIDVKQIARDIDGKMLELTSAHSDKVTRKTERKISEEPDHVNPSSPKLLREDSRHMTKNVDSIQDEQKPVKKTLFIWLGAACVLVGVLLPWVSAQMQTPFGTQYGRATGLELNQGLLSISVGVFSAVLGFVAARRTIPARLVALSIIITGIVVIGVTLDVIDGISTSDLGFRGMKIISVRQNPEPGVFIALIGGGFLALGGLIALIRTRKQKG